MKHAREDYNEGIQDNRQDSPDTVATEEIPLDISEADEIISELNKDVTTLNQSIKFLKAVKNDLVNQLLAAQCLIKKLTKDTDDAVERTEEVKDTNPIYS